ALADQAAGIIGVSPAASVIELATEVTAMGVGKLKLLAAGLLVAGGLTLSGVGLWSKAEAQGPPPGGLPPGAGGGIGGGAPPGVVGGPVIPPPRQGGVGTGAPDGGGPGMPPGMGGPGGGGMMGGAPAPRAAFEYLFVAKPGTLPEVAAALRGKAAQNWEYTGPLDVDPSDPKGLRGVEGVTKDTRVVLVFKRAAAPMPGMGMMGGGGMMPGGVGGMAGPGPGGMGGGLGGGMPGGSGLPPPLRAGGTGSPDGGDGAKETKVFRLKYKPADELAREVMSAFTDTYDKPAGKNLSVTSDPRVNALTFWGTAADLKGVEQIIAALDVPPGEVYEVIKLKNANAEDVAKVLNEVFNGPGGKGSRVAVVAEKGSNAVVVTKASAADLKTIKELVKNAMDVRAAGGR
ncbi:MAG: secretin N-terminal domain-containing protein, partial [Gemmataceae bacterium]